MAAVSGGPTEHGGSGRERHREHGGLAERLISLGTMDRRLRLITGLAIAQVAAAAAMVALRDAGGGTTEISVTEGFLTVMPTVTFWLAVAFTALTWSYLLAGALHAHVLVLRLAALGGFTAIMWETVSRAAPGATQQVLSVVLLVVVWLIGALTVLSDRRAARRGALPRPPTHLRGALFLALLACVVGLFAVARWGAGEAGSERLFTLGFSLQLAVLSLAVIPALFASGAEFAEWGELAGDRLGALLGRLPSWLGGALTAAVAALVIADLLRRYHLAPMGRQLVLGALFALIAWALWRRRLPAGQQRPGVPLAAVGAVAVAFLAVFLVAILAPAVRGAREEARRGALPGLGRLAPYSRSDRPAFSIVYPAAWSVEPLAGTAEQTFVTFAGAGAGDPALFVVAANRLRAGRPAPGLRELVGVGNQRRRYSVGRARPDGPWRRAPIEVRLDADTLLTGVGWTRRAGGYVWTLFGYGSSRLAKLNDPLFARMVKTWQPRALPGGEASRPREGGHGGGAAKRPHGATDVDRALAAGAAFWLLVALASGAAIATRRRWLASGRRYAGALFVALAAALFVLGSLVPVSVVLTGEAPGWVAGLRLAGVQAIAAVLTLAILAGSLLARRAPAHLGKLLTLNVGLQVLAWIADLYAGALEVGARFSVAQALIICLAIGWELVTSGESVTNAHSRRFPRSSRVMLYCGYLTLTATAILYFSSLRNQASGRGIEALFESDIWPHLGIQQLGAPLLVVLLLLRLAARREELAQ